MVSFKITILGFLKEEKGNWPNQFPCAMFQNSQFLHFKYWKLLVYKTPLWNLRRITSPSRASVFLTYKTRVEHRLRLQVPFLPWHFYHSVLLYTPGQKNELNAYDQSIKMNHDNWVPSFINALLPSTISRKIILIMWWFLPTFFNECMTWSDKRHDVYLFSFFIWVLVARVPLKAGPYPWAKCPSSL